MPVNGGGLPQPVVALIVADHGPGPDVLPCHNTVIGLLPGGEIIVPWLDGEMLQLTVSPDGTPLNV